MLIEAVIFDMDGLMLDTEPVYRTAWQQASAECGYVLSDILYLRLIGHNRPDAEQMLLHEFGLQFPLDLFRTACQRCEAMAFASSPLRKKCGLDELLRFLDSRRVPKAVATSTDRQVAIQLLATTGLLAQFDIVTAADDVAKGKPFPDLFLLAAQRLGVKNSACLVLEDAEPGVIAAHCAGMKVYIVPDQRTLPVTVQRLANGTFESLAAVVQHLKLASTCSTQVKGCLQLPSDLAMMQDTQANNDHVTQTIATYNVIAPDYKLTATPEMRAWEEKSMRMFGGFLPGKRVLVPGCGDGRDSRFLASLGLAITSFDLSEEMLRLQGLKTRKAAMS